MARTDDGTGRPSIVDRFACAADGHEVRGIWLACCQCGQEDMVWRCIWCGTTSEQLCEWSICDGHRITLACCRELEDRPRYLMKLVGVGMSLDALLLRLRPPRTRRTDT